MSFLALRSATLVPRWPIGIRAAHRRSLRCGRRPYAAGSMASSSPDAGGGDDSVTTTESPAEEDNFGLREMFAEVKDAQKLGSRGEGWLLSVVLASGLLVCPPVNLVGLIGAFGWLLAAAGAIFVAYAVLALGRNNFPLPYPRKNAEFVKKGIYAHVRHPQYSGVLLLCLGLSAITRNEVGLVDSHFCHLEGQCGCRQEQLSA